MARLKPLPITIEHNGPPMGKSRVRNMMMSVGAKSDWRENLEVWGWGLGWVCCPDGLAKQVLLAPNLSSVATKTADLQIVVLKVVREDIRIVCGLCVHSEFFHLAEASH